MLGCGGIIALLSALEVAKVDLDSNAEQLHKSIAMRVYDGILKGDYALLGVYLPEQVLDHVANLCGEHLNSFGYENGRAALKIASPLLSRVLDDVRDRAHPNRRWCVLAKNVCRIFEKSRGSLCGANLSGLDLTECDFSAVALSSLGLVADLSDSVIRFDSFVRYRLPNLRKGELPCVALDVNAAGRIMMACGSLLLHIVPQAPLKSRIICDISPELGDGWAICRLRYDRSGRCVMITATNDMPGFDAATAINPYSDGDLALRCWLFDGRNLIPCHDEREPGNGGIIRRRGEDECVYLEGWELARFRYRHCWELATGDPVRDELSAKDRLFSGNLRYKYENERVTDRFNHSVIAFVHAGAASRSQPQQSLCALNTTAGGCNFDRIHPDSVITLEQINLLKGKAL